MQIASSNQASSAPAAALSALQMRQPQDGYTWLHGHEGVTMDASGYVYWRGREVEHFSYHWRDRRDEESAAKRLKLTCQALEAAGKTVTSAAYLDWIRVLATVHVVNSKLFTDMLGCAAYYRRAGHAMRSDAELRIKRAAQALAAIDGATGLTARLDNEWYADPTAIILVKVAEVASRETTNAALDELRQRFLHAYPAHGPHAVAALVRESRHEDDHYAGYVGVRLYAGKFEAPCCPSVNTTLQVVREFARACGR